MLTNKGFRMRRFLLFIASILIVLRAYGFEEQAGLPEALRYPFIYIQEDSKATESEHHKIQLLEDGLESLQKRFDIIRNANKTIEVEYFIYRLDKAGKLLTLELIEAAKRGVKVRILVDKSFTVFKMDKYIANALKDYNVELRYYNDSKDPTRAQYRTHRKMVVADANTKDRVAIIGGRNIGEEYFDMSHEFNFHDRDVYVKGPVVKAIADTFNEFWEDDLTVAPERVPNYKKPKRTDFDHHSVYEKDLYRKAMRIYRKWEKGVKKGHDFVTMTEEDRALLQKIEIKTRKNLDGLKNFSCPNLTFSSDLPGARYTSLVNIGRRNRRDFTDKHKALRKVIDYKLQNTHESLVVDSPYLITNKIVKDLIDYLNEKDVKFTLYTNSLASTDGIYIAANFYSISEYRRRRGMEVYLHTGKYFGEENPMVPEIKDVKWGTHSKTHIYDGQEVMIGTYNIDNRSNYFNAEMALFCKGDQAFVDEVSNKIKYRMHNGLRMISRKRAIDKDGNEVSAFGEVSIFGKIVMKLISPFSIALKYLL